MEAVGKLKEALRLVEGLRDTVESRSEYVEIHQKIAALADFVSGNNLCDLQEALKAGVSAIEELEDDKQKLEAENQQLETRVGELTEYAPH